MLVEKLYLDNLLCVDKLHYKEVKILNALYEVVLQKDIEKIDEYLDALVKDVENHFESEEKKMFEYKYPKANMHQFVHGSALKRLHDAQKQWISSHDVAELQIYLEKVFTPWLNGHIRSMDLDACDYIVSKNGK